MQEIILNNKKYTKAADIAKHLGYTSDYVGQLCRAEKVEAKLVGRSWFVLADSLKAYKQEAKRSNLVKSKAAVQHYKLSQKEVTSAPRQSASRHVHVTHYESDDADLIPRLARDQVAKSSRSPAREAEIATQHSVPITKTSTVRKFAPADKPRIPFTGTLQVKTVDVQPEVAVASTPVDKKPTAKVVTPPASRSARLKSTRHIAVTQLHDEISTTVAVSVNATKTRPRNRGALFVWVLLFGVIFAAITVFAATLTTITVSDGTQAFMLDWQPLVSLLDSII